MGSIIVPIFYGEDPELWIEWIDSFVSAHSFSDFETIQFAYGFIEGEALEWYCDEIARSVFNSWDDLKRRLFQRFGKSLVGAEKLSLQDRLKQLSRDMDRWDKEEETNKLHVETLVADDPKQGGSCDGGLEIIAPTLGLIQPMGEQEEKYESVSLVALEMDEPLLRKSVTTWSSEENEGSGNLKVGQYYERGKSVMDEWFESGETNRMEEYQQRKEKLLENNMDECAYQLFDHMLRRRKKVAKKKKRWKGTTRKNRLQRRVTRAKGFKYKFGAVHILTCHKSLRLMKHCRPTNLRVVCNMSVLAKKWMWKLTKKMKMCKHKLGHERWNRESKRVLTKLEKWKKRKVKQLFNKLKQMIKLRVLGNQNLLLCVAKLSLDMAERNYKCLSKGKQSRENIDVSDESMELNCLEKQIEKLLFAAVTRRRTTSWYIGVAHEILLSLVKLGRPKFLLMWEELHARYNRQLVNWEVCRINDLIEVTWLCTSMAEIILTTIHLGRTLTGEETDRELQGIKDRLQKNALCLLDRLFRPGIIGRKWNHIHFQCLRRRGSIRQSMIRMKKCKTVTVCCIFLCVLDRLLMWVTQIRKKTRSWNRADWYHVLRDARSSKAKGAMKKNDAKDMWWLLKMKIMVGAGRKRQLFKILGPTFVQALESFIKHCVGIERTQVERPTSVWLVMQLHNRVEAVASLYLWSEPVSTRKVKESLKTVKLEKFRMEISEHPSVIIVTCDLFHSQRPPEQPIESWSAGQWSVMGSNCGRRVISRSYNQTKLKLKLLWELHLSNISLEEEHKSLYEPVLKGVSVDQSVDEALYFNPGTFPSPRPPELNQKDICWGGCRQELVQVNRLHCFFNFWEINFPHEPGGKRREETFQEKEVKSIRSLDILLGINQKWSSDERGRTSSTTLRTRLILKGGVLLRGPFSEDTKWLMDLSKWARS